MAKKVEIDWQKFVNYNMEQQNIAEFTKKLQEMTGRELYEMGTYCLVNRYLIDRPVSYAFHRTVLNYPVEPIDIMKACLIDGTVILRVEGAEHIRIEPHATKAEWGAFSNTLDFVEIKYVYEEANGEEYYHIEHYHRGGVDPDGRPLTEGATWTVYAPVRDDTVDEKHWQVVYVLWLPLFPFVGIRWIDSQSFLAPLKMAVIRLEAAYRVIGAENIERMGLSLYIEGVTNVEDIKTAPRKMGRRVHILPKNAKFHSPSPDEPGMELMIQEIEHLHVAIEKASGVVATEKLATLSGISRAVAEKPLVMLADELRDRFADGMVEVVDLVRLMEPGAEELILTYRPMKHIEDKKMYLVTLDRAREADAIDDEEYARELRLLLDLSPEKAI